MQHSGKGKKNKVATKKGKNKTKQRIYSETF
jgi:hypothetical protein